MKPLKIAAVVVLVVCVIMVIVITIQPERAHLEREIFIEAADSVIFPYVSNYRKLSTWWPWPKMDADLKQSYEGVDGTLGSKVIWSGAKAGNGSLTIQELIQNKSVKSVMVIASQKQSAVSEFRLEVKDNGTQVHWSYDGVNDGLLGKAKWIVMGTLLNSQYDLGLKNLKKIIEDKEPPHSSN